MVLPATALEDAARFCERVRAKVEAQAFAWKEQVLHVTISLGGTSTQAGEDQAVLLARADARLLRGETHRPQPLRPVLTH